jgi:hypothetical protein
MQQYNKDGSFLTWGYLISVRHTLRPNRLTQSAMVFQRNYKVTDFILKANFNNCDFDLRCQAVFFPWKGEANRLACL